MTTPRIYHTFTAFANNMKVLAVSGENYYPQETAEVYDSATNTWILTLTNMLTARYSHTATLLGNGQILIVGGYDSSDRSLSEVEIYIPSSNSFISTDSMITPRFHCTSTLLADKSTVLVTGGTNKNKPIKSAEPYIGNSWIFASDMTQQRSHHAAVLLNDGTVLIAGGDRDHSNPYSTAEIYNSTMRTFTPVGLMGYRRKLFTLTLLPDGKVLATGGYDETTGSHLIVSELYDPLTRSW